MKLRVKHSLAYLLTAVLISCMIAGCVRTTATEDYSQTVVAKFGSENIYLDEAAYMARAVQYSYEAVFGSSTDFWNYNYSGNGDTMESMVKESVMQQIYQTRVLVNYANENGIELTDEQETKVAETVADIMKDATYAKAVGATEELLMDIYTENAIANAVYLKLTEDVDTDINEEDYLHKSYDYIKITESSDSTDDVKTQEEEAAEDILAEMKAGTDLEDIVSEYSDADFTVQNSTNSFMLSEELSYGEFAWELAEGECGSTYVEGEGWYILKCTSENDEESRDTAIEDELESRKQDAFTEKYEEIKKTAPKFTVDEDVWALIDFKTAVYVRTDSDAQATDSDAQTASEVAETETTVD